MIHARVFVAALIVVSYAAEARAQLVRFRRGDSNADARLDISDAGFSLGYLFLDGPAPLCVDAADSNDDSRLDISDAVHSLGYLFLGAPPPPFPGPDGCGFDPSDDDLDCRAYPHCPQLPTSPPPPPPLLDPFPGATVEISIVLSGTVDPGVAAVEISGGVEVVLAAIENAAFAAEVPLRPNHLNTLYATALSPDGDRSAPQVARIVQDLGPPVLHVDSPRDGAELTDASVVVLGRVGDLLSGFMGLAVSVNGEPADVVIGIGTNGTFERAGVPLAFGANSITVRASDALGNQVERSITSTAGPRKARVSPCFRGTLNEGLSDRGSPCR